MGHPFRREPSMSEKDRILVRHSPECPRDTSLSLSLNLADGWIMVSTQSGTHFANRQTPDLLTLAPFERLNQGNIVATGTHVRGERIRHVGMIADLEPSILLMEVQHQSPSVRICVSNASRSSLGKALPLLSARRMIPAQALALKKYRRGTPPVSSVDDKEHTLAPLGHTEELSVQHSPCTPPSGQSSATASRSDWKARPCSADRTPGTFSHTIHSGSISAQARRYSSMSWPRGSSRAFLSPAMLNAWQGLPPTTTSAAWWYSFQLTFVMSPKSGTFG